MGRFADNAAAERFFGVLKRERVNRQRSDESRGEGRELSLHRVVSQSRPAAETGDAATTGETLTSTVRDIGVEPWAIWNGLERASTLASS